MPHPRLGISVPTGDGAAPEVAVAVPLPPTQELGASLSLSESSSEGDGGEKRAPECNDANMSAEHHSTAAVEAASGWDSDEDDAGSPDRASAEKPESDAKAPSSPADA